VTVAILVLVACGDDTTNTDSDAAVAQAASGELGRFCGALLRFEQAGATGPDDYDAQSFQLWARNEVRPALEELVASAPTDLADDWQATSEVFAELERTGDPAVFEDPRLQSGPGPGDVGVERCGWTKQEFNATEYRFDGLPDRLAAGVVDFVMTGAGNELHEAALVRRKDGVTEPAEELLELAGLHEEEALDRVDLLGSILLFDTDGIEDMVVDLQPGDYILFCALPIGASSEDLLDQPDATPHWSEGMVHEFTVD